MWRCKECGGKIRATVTSYLNEDYNIDENGNEIGKCLRKIEGEMIARNYHCNKCNTCYDDETDIEDIAYWEE